jgi:hypothetical protein
MMLTNVNEGVILLSRPSHPNKEIEEAVANAESQGWRVNMSKKGHCWASA